MRNFFFVKITTQLGEYKSSAECADTLLLLCPRLEDVLFTHRGLTLAHDCKTIFVFMASRLVVLACGNHTETNVFL